MKRIFTFLVLTALLLGGCGSGQTGSPSSAPQSAEEKILTEAEVLTAYEAAAEAYDWFSLSGLPVSGEVVQADGRDFQVVTDARFPTLTALETHLKTLFSDELTAELLADGQYRDIDGKLYGTGGARGSNIYMVGKTASAAQAEEGRWTVTLTFYADSWEMERPAVTIGYSRKTIDYVNQDGKWVFSTFCPGDDLDLEAETVYHFAYDDATFDAYPYPDYSDLQLALYLLRADGACSEGTSDLFAHRFLEHTESVMAALAVVAESPWENRETVVSSIGYSAAAWFAPELLPDFEGTLTSYSPKNEAEQAVLEKISSAYQTSDERGAQSIDTAMEFGFAPMGAGTLYLDAQEGHFPWGLDLTGEPEIVEGSDFGQGYTVECGSVQIYFFEASADGVQYIPRMSTTVPYTEDACVSTVRGTYCGYDLETLLHQYPKAVRLDAEGYDGMYVYEPSGTKHIAFYIKDGVVVKIEMENLIDSRLLSE